MRRTLSCCTGAIVLATVLVGCGDDGDAPDDDAAVPSTTGDGPVLTVGARDDLTFDEDSYTVEGGDVQIVYRNEGSVAHTLLIEGIDGFKLSVGDEDEGTVALEPGAYEMYCDVAGHQSAGMEAELTVT